ncbi:hypothetical protein [Lentilactobacillus parabuchneri]|uniref:hypothetical protein n=1 Tax=Lentilactobacillus parabuchneri TaxID=152331 RepID=UPI0023081C7F|nr:hypothetical protein [Lentilactobacillus parabuchneri]MDB1104672.1 hypothetical protein [Lentilactobacillus parabuchneri]
MSELQKNDQVIFMSAKEDLADQRYQQVLNKTEHLLNKYPDSIAVNDLHAVALFYLKRYEEAKAIILAFQESFFNQPDYLKDAFKIFLKSNSFMLAREAVAAAKTDLHDAWTHEVEQTESAYRTDNSAKLQQASRHFVHIGALSVAEQVQAVQSSVTLPLKEYVRAARAIMSDPFVWQVVKTQVLLQLVRIDLKYRFDMVWLDGKTYTIRTGELKPLDQYESFVGVLQAIEKQFATDDPIKLELLEKELFTQGNYIYPFFDKVITDSQFWAKAIIARSFGDMIKPDNDQEQLMLSWITKIYDEEIKIDLI